MKTKKRDPDDLCRALGAPTLAEADKAAADCDVAIERLRAARAAYKNSSHLEALLSAVDALLKADARWRGIK